MGIAAGPARVTVAGVSIIDLHGRVGSISAAERAGLVEERIRKLARERFFAPSSLAIAPSEIGLDIVAGDKVILTITESEAKALKQTKDEIAKASLEKIQEAIEADRVSRTPKDIMTRAAYLFIATALLGLVLFGISCFFRRVRRYFAAHAFKRRPFRLGELELFSAADLSQFYDWSLRLTRLILTFSVLYFYVPLALSFFPRTANLAPHLLVQFLAPIRKMGGAIFDFLPNLFSIVVICLFTRVLLRTIRLLFSRIERGAVKIRGFYPDWGMPTYKLVRTFVLILTAVATFPYIPGAHSPAFQAVSVFLGVLVSLGSTSAIANMVSGTVLTYMRPFKIGDRVKIADTVGDVIEKSLLVTRVRTVKNVDVTIPNSMVLGSHIVNYSSSAKEGLILNTSVTIGYDVPWPVVHRLLVQAARQTEKVATAPEPFVLQTSLNDFSVAYELNAFTHFPNEMAPLYSKLHENIQNEFNRAGVEILSPNYVAYRDGNGSTVSPGREERGAIPIKPSHPHPTVS